jgi:hypothetical protein
MQQSSEKHISQLKQVQYSSEPGSFLGYAKCEHSDSQKKFWDNYWSG